MAKLPFIYEKLKLLIQKNLDRDCPPTKLEENLSRDFRLCRDDVKKIMLELKLEHLNDDYRKVLKRRKEMHHQRAMPEYDRQTEEDFLRGLRDYR